MNRSTFYAHYQNQYDLLRQIEAEALEDLTAYLLEEAPRTYNVTKILEYAQANADLFIVLLDESDGAFQRQIMELAHVVDLRPTDEPEACLDDRLEYMYPVSYTHLTRHQYRKS